MIVIIDRVSTTSGMLKKNTIPPRLCKLGYPGADQYVTNAKERKAIPMSDLRNYSKKNTLK